MEQKWLVLIAIVVITKTIQTIKAFIIKDGMYAIAAVAPVLVDVGKGAEQLARFQSICLDEAEREGRERGRRITESGAMWEQRGAQKT